jgi:predicted phage terminase large subunit-like protein
VDLNNAELINLAQSIALKSFQNFIEIVCPEFQIAKHHLEMIRLIEDTILKPSGKALAAMPPRHSKSYLFSNLLPAYLMTKYESYHVIVASYSSELSLDLGRRTRSIFESDLYRKVFPHVSVATDSSSKTRFHLNNGSSFFAVGVGGSLTGKSASILILDDGYKGLEQAMSTAYQETIEAWFSGTFYTRRLTGAPMFIVNTLWTLNDIGLKLSQAQPNEWSVLKLPAISPDGSALWPEMFSIVELEQMKAQMGSRIFQALYQADPQSLEGNTIKRSWLKYYKQLPTRFNEKLMSWDLTFTDKESSDYVVGQVWGAVGADKYLIDQVRARMDFPATIQAIRQMAFKHPDAYSKVVEEKANGAAAIATLRREISGLIPFNPKTSKETRLFAVSPDIESGNVYLPDPSIAPWVGDLVEELCSFPNGRHDDCVDALTQALLRFRVSGGDNLRKLVTM